MGNSSAGLQKILRSYEEKNMSEQDFAKWVIEAEKLRDEMLENYNRDNSIDLTEYTENLNKI